MQPKHPSVGRKTWFFKFKTHAYVAPNHPPAYISGRPLSNKARRILDKNNSLMRAKLKNEIFWKHCMWRMAGNFGDRKWTNAFELKTCAYMM